MSSAPSGPPAENGILNSAPVRFVRLVSEASLAAIVAAYAIIICTQVFYRYALNSSLVWSEEVVRFALLWGVMIGAGVATDRLAHIALDPLANTITSPRGRYLHAFVIGILTIIFCVVVIYASWGYISRLWNITSPAAHIPMRYVFAALPVGCGLMIFFTIVHLIAGPPKHPHDPASEHLS